MPHFNPSLLETVQEASPFCAGFLKRALDAGVSPEALTTAIVQSAALDPSIRGLWERVFEKVAAEPALPSWQEALKAVPQEQQDLARQYQQAVHSGQMLPKGFQGLPQAYQQAVTHSAYQPLQQQAKTDIEVKGPDANYAGGAMTNWALRSPLYRQTVENAYNYSPARPTVNTVARGLYNRQWLRNPAPGLLGNRLSSGLGSLLSAGTTGPWDRYLDQLVPTQTTQGPDGKPVQTLVDPATLTGSGYFGNQVTGRSQPLSTDALSTGLDAGGTALSVAMPVSGLASSAAGAGAKTTVQQIPVARGWEGTREQVSDLAGLGAGIGAGGVTAKRWGEIPKALSRAASGVKSLTQLEQEAAAAQKSVATAQTAMSDALHSGYGQRQLPDLARQWSQARGTAQAAQKAVDAARRSPLQRLGQLGERTGQWLISNGGAQDESIIARLLQRYPGLRPVQTGLRWLLDPTQAISSGLGRLGPYGQAARGVFDKAMFLPRSLSGAGSVNAALRGQWGRAGLSMTPWLLAPLAGRDPMEAVTAPTSWPGRMASVYWDLARGNPSGALGTADRHVVGPFRDLATNTLQPLNQVAGNTLHRWDNPWAPIQLAGEKLWSAGRRFFGVQGEGFRQEQAGESPSTLAAWAATRKPMELSDLARILARDPSLPQNQYRATDYLPRALGGYGGAVNVPSDVLVQRADQLRQRYGLPSLEAASNQSATPSTESQPGQQQQVAQAQQALQQMQQNPEARPNVVAPEVAAAAKQRLQNDPAIARETAGMNFEQQRQFIEHVWASLPLQGKWLVAGGFGLGILSLLAGLFSD